MLALIAFAFYILSFKFAFSLLKEGPAPPLHANPLNP